jgi:hypothetical protein
MASKGIGMTDRALIEVLTAKNIVQPLKLALLRFENGNEPQF